MRFFAPFEFWCKELHPTTAADVKNNKKLEKKSIELYSKYRSSAMEIDADNVALALLFRIDKTKNRVLGRYADNVFGLSEKTRNLRRLPEQEEIRAFNERGRTNHFGLGRLDNIVDTKRYFQSAYTGSPVKYEKPSLDYIGTGEGAQAHGWGLYFAENKDVAEGYRKRLTSSCRVRFFAPFEFWCKELHPTARFR